MSLLASVLPSRSQGALQGIKSENGSLLKNLSHVTPTLKLSDESSTGVKFQQSSSDNGTANAQSLRFYLPMVMDAVNEVSYKVTVPNFALLPPLRLGSKFITDLTKIDSMTPNDLYGASHNNKQPGLDNYYFDPKNGLGEFSRFAKVGQMDLPDKFFEEHNTTQTATKMGIFPELNRAWIIADNRLVFWNYQVPQSSFNMSSQFFTMDQVRHSILAVSLVKPKPDIFVKEVNHLLLVATTMDIHIFLVKHNPSTNDMQIFGSKLSVATQGLIINQFAFDERTCDIYFTGEGDGVNVWRLDYSNNHSLIRNRCEKVCLTKSGFSSVIPIGKITGFDVFNNEQESNNNKSGAKVQPVHEHLIQLEVDSQRGIMYSLSNKSVIRVYKLEPKQEQFSKHSQLTPTELFKSLTQMIPDTANIKSFSKFKLVALKAITQAESSQVQLIAITNTGGRILIKMGGVPSYSSFMSNNKSHYSLRLSVHSMKFPPTSEEPKVNTELDSYTRIKEYVAQMTTLQQNAETLKRTKFAKIISPGVFLAVKKTHGSDKLFLSSVNYGFLKHNGKYVEDAEFIEFGSSNSSEAISIHDVVQLTPSMNATETPSGFANVLASQYSKQPLKFAVLTNLGITVFQYRTSDQIIGSLKDGIVENFIEENGYEETCSTLLYLACSYGHQKTNEVMKRRAALMFSHAGNNARLVEVDNGAGQTHMPIQPAETQPVIEQVVLSDRFYGTCLLISRIFRSVWSQKVFLPVPHIKFTPGGAVETSSIKEDNLLIQGLSLEKSRVEYFIGSVIVIIDFLEENMSGIPGLGAPAYSSDPSKLDNEVCTRAEHIAFTSILRSLNAMKESLSFLMVLFEETQSSPNGFGEIFKFLAVTNQLNLLTLSYKDLLLPQSEVKNLIKDVVSSIINKNILKGGSIDLIASSLQGRCGSLCSADDVYIFKAIENLTRAKNIGSRDNDMKIKCLKNAIELFEKASESLTFENVENSLNIMLSLEFYTGAVQFILKLAKKCNTYSTATTTALVTSNAIDASSLNEKVAENNRRRTQLYDLVFKILQQLDVEAITVRESNNQLQINDFNEMRDAAYETCFASSDKSFHYEFYWWFIHQGYSERLLSVNTPFILPFLEEVSANDLALTELLWLYHAKKENYHWAARILYGLSISDFDLTLEQRIECLSRANGFSNCACPPNERQNMIQLAQTIRELFEVANVQLELLNTIQADTRLSRENKSLAKLALNHKIQSASELFNGYADSLGYFQICFLIFKVSDYKNPDEITKRWELFFEKVDHEYSLKKGSTPLYVLLDEALTSLNPRIVSSDIVFPVEKVFKLVCKYIHKVVDESGGKEKPPKGAVVDTFLKCGIEYDKLYVSIKKLIEHNSYDMYNGFVTYLQTSEMTTVLEKWYRADKRLRDAVPAEKVIGLAEYLVATDPIHKWFRQQSTFI